MREISWQLKDARRHLEIADRERGKAKQTPDPDLVVYYIEHADWAIGEALSVLAEEEEETCEKSAGN